MPEKTATLKLTNTHIAIIIFLAAASAIAFFVGSTLTGQVTARQALEKCREIQNHPDLKVPCVCVPTPVGKYANESPEIEEATAPLCTCTCYLKDNTTTVIDVRTAR